jgi:hypothetical protein
LTRLDECSSRLIFLKRTRGDELAQRKGRLVQLIIAGAVLSLGEPFQLTP